MSNKITKPQMCILMRSGIEIWINKDKSDKIVSGFNKNELFQVEGRLINPVDVSGIFTPQDLEELHHRKRGDWLCRYDVWHKQHDTCYCGQQPNPKHYE